MPLSRQPLHSVAVGGDSRLRDKKGFRPFIPWSRSPTGINLLVGETPTREGKRQK